MNWVAKSIVSVLLIGAPVPALAGECDGALIDGTRSERRWSENYVLNQLKYNWISEQAASNSESNISSSIEIPVKSIPLSGSYTEARKRAYRQSMERLDYERIDSSFAGEYLISSGDRGILDTWLKCMQSRAGLVAYFERANSREAILVIQWHNGNDRDKPFETYLTEAIGLPVWAKPQRQSGSTPCWEKAPLLAKTTGIKLSERGVITERGCRIRINFDAKHPDRLKAFTVTVNATDGSATAHLAPRTRIVELRKTIKVQLASEPLMGGNTRGHFRTVSTNWTLPNEFKSKGWILDPGSFRSNLANGAPTTSVDPHHAHACHPIRPDPKSGEIEGLEVGDDFVTAKVGITNQRTGWNLACMNSGTIDVFQLKAQPL